MVTIYLVIALGLSLISCTASALMVLVTLLVSEEI